MESFSPRKLAERLIEKHDRLISEYSDEVEKVQQITMLKEKRDQLQHWVVENGGKKRYSKELDETEKELNQLRESFKVRNQRYYAGLKDRIEKHKNAREYWLDKIGEKKT